jgi:monofunctional biosynthetic peptidoglycan transglycosylase
LIAAGLPNPKVYTVVPLSGYVAVKHYRILGQMNNLQNDPDIQKLLQ